MDPNNLFPNPYASAEPPPPQPEAPPAPPLSKKPLLLIGGVILTIILGLSIIAVVVMSKSGPSTKPATKKADATNPVQQLEGASALDIEQINQSISQDISSLNDGQDFSADKISDKTLGL